MLFNRELTFEDRVIVVNKYRVTPWIDVTRGNSVLCNPFPITETRNRKSALAEFRSHAKKEMADPASEFRQEIRRIARLLLDTEITIRLGCVCKPKKCHAEILRELIIREARKMQRKSK